MAIDRISTREAVIVSTPILRRCRRRSTSTVAGSCAACVRKGMAASRPTMIGVAPSERANATRMTPPQNAPDMLAQARSRTSARWPAARSSGVTVWTGSSIAPVSTKPMSHALSACAATAHAAGERR